MAKRRMPPALAAYWAAKRRGRRSARSSSSMPKFRRTRRAATAVRGGYRKFRGSRAGRRMNFQRVTNGALTNVGARVGAQFLGPQWGPPAGMMLAGVLLNDETAQFMAGMALGGSIPLGGFGAQQPGGGYI